MPFSNIKQTDFSLDKFQSLGKEVSDDSSNDSLEINNLMTKNIHDILTTINENPVTNVISSSGTGKSTILPLEIQRAGNKIVVVVSNEDVVISLSKYNPDIKYISRNDMKNKLYSITSGLSNSQSYDLSQINSFDLSQINILMIDEADSSALDVTLIMLLWRYAVENKFKVPKLVLVSSNEINNEMFDIKHYFIQTNELPEIRYLEKSMEKSEIFPLNLTSLIYDIYNEVDGDILVFSPFDINSSDLTGLNIYTDENLNDIYSDKNRKVIISQKLAETTVTLPNLSVIIDTLQDIKPRLTLTGGVRYKNGYITKQQADLRASRGAKLVIRLLPLEKYERLLDYELSEIYSRPLYHTMLEMLEHNLDPFNVLTMFNREELDRNYDLLIKLGVINSLGKVTDIGKFIRKIPLGIKNAVGLYKWLQTGYPVYPGLVLLTMIDSFGSYFVYPLKSNQSHSEYNLELLEHRKKYFNPFEGKSDIHTYSNIWNIMLDEINFLSRTDEISSLPSKISSLSNPSLDNEISDWSKNNYINTEILLEVNKVVTGISFILQSESKSGNYDVGTFDTDNTVSLIGPILADIYSDRTFNILDKKSVRIRYYNNEKYYKIDSQQSINSIERNTPDIVYGLITSTISSTYTSDFHLISCSLVID